MSLLGYLTDKLVCGVAQIGRGVTRRDTEFRCETVVAEKDGNVSAPVAGADTLGKLLEQHAHRQQRGREL